MNQRFSKPFTQQEPIDEDTIERVADILRGGRLHRYNVLGEEVSQVSLLETEYAAFQETPFCLAATSGGQAIQIALRAAGVTPGDQVLANAYTLAPVPGAIHATGGVPVFVEIDKTWHINLVDLAAKAEQSDAKFLLLSHMRGHIADMDGVVEICKRHDITLIEDCAHTMGASWNGVKSGNFGAVACFSTQTYKHMNSGEGGFLTTFDEDISARAVIISGSYMLYEKHGARPSEEAFDRNRLNHPNCSARLDNLRACLLRSQIASLPENIQRWNKRYRILEEKLHNAKGLSIMARNNREHFVGSSIQFHGDGIGVEQIPALVANCASRGVELKWFGPEEPVGFTSRYDSWKYLGDQPALPATLNALSTTCDMRIPLTFDEADCALIGDIIAQESAALFD